MKLQHEMWRRGSLRYKLWDQQLPIYDAIRGLPEHVDEAVVLCARQFGKSHLGVVMALEDCLRWKDRCFLVMGPTLKQTRAIVSPRLRAIAADAPPGLIRPSKSEGIWYVGTSELVMGGFDLSTGSQRGKTLQGVYVEEVVDSNPDDYLDSFRSDIGPALSHSQAGKITYLTTLPKIPDHPFIIETMSKAQLADAFYSFTIDDNRALSPAQYEACVRRAGGRHTDDFKREYLNQIIRDRSIVIIPDFDRARHVADINVPDTCNWQVYVDWGGVRDLTVAIVIGYDYLIAKDIVVAELWWKPNTPTQQIVDDLRRAWAGKWLQRDKLDHVIYADVPGQVAVDLHKSHKMSTIMPQKSDWEASINGMANRFTTDHILIDSSCKFLITTCQSGTFNKQHTDFERTQTLGHADAIAALMYAIRGLDRSNPYSAHHMPTDRYFKRPEIVKDPLESIVPAHKSFAQKGMKRFGA